MSSHSQSAPCQRKQHTIALVGNPNCGKTTLFNALTLSWQQVGNWSGVTVERKVGSFTLEENQVDIVDLPGTYTLTTIEPQGPQDENITSDYLRARAFSLVLNVVDALHIERNLYLTLQCLEQNLPVIIALNRIDLAHREVQELCTRTLATDLGCQIIPIVAREGTGLEALKAALIHPKLNQFPPIPYPAAIEEALEILTQCYADKNQGKIALRHQLLRWLEGEPLPCDPDFEKDIASAQFRILLQTTHSPDVLIAKARYDLIERLLAKARKPYQHPTKAAPRFNITHVLDKLVCHRYLGFPCFLMVMYGLFFFAINIGGVFQDFFELSSDLFFVDGLHLLLSYLGAAPWLSALFASGLGKGVSTILSFVPVIGAMFFALAFLEDSGYMARAAFVVDRLMRAIGLPGKSFVPMIVGFGCNVPAIMGARTLDNKRDRIMSVMMSPFMSCGARLAIFTVFVAAFFPKGGQNIVFLLYFIGIVMAMLTGLLLKKTVLRGEIAPLLLEMPDYQWPHWRSLWFHCWHRLRRFVVNAGKLILPVCMLVGLLNSLSTQGKWLEAPHQTSLLSAAGQMIVPVFKPLGVEEDNWPAAVGLLTGILAKEVVIGTLNSLYTHQNDMPASSVEFHLGERMKAAVLSIPENLVALVSAWRASPIFTSVEQLSMGQHAHNEMISRFHGQVNAFAYLLFVLLYFPCVSATAAMVREVQKGWTIFSVCWTTGLAYSIAVTYYQAATFMEHPVQSSSWISTMVGVWIATYYGIRFYGREYLPKRVPTPIVVN